MNQGCGPEKGVAEPGWLWLNDEGDRRGVELTGPEVLEDVAFAGGDHEADLFRTPQDHPFEKILAYGAGAFRAAIQARADGEQLLREGERLNATAGTGGWN